MDAERAVSLGNQVFLAGAQGFPGCGRKRPFHAGRGAPGHVAVLAQRRAGQAGARAGRAPVRPPHPRLPHDRCRRGLAAGRAPAGGGLGPPGGRCAGLRPLRPGARGGGGAQCPMRAAAAAGDPRVWRIASRRAGGAARRAGARGACAGAQWRGRPGHCHADRRPDRPGGVAPAVGRVRRRDGTPTIRWRRAGRWNGRSWHGRR